MVYVLYCDNLFTNDFFERGLVSFPASFQQKLRRLKRQEDANASLLGRLLLQKGLYSFFNLDFDPSLISYNFYGKPQLPDLGINFSISHSGHLVVCAICRNEQIGIDLEHVRDVELDIFRNQMTLREWSVLCHSNCMNVFFNLWTRKEAVVKALGKGLYVPLNSFDVIAKTANVEDVDFFIYNLLIDSDYSCSLALSTNIRDDEISTHRTIFRL